MLNAHNQQWGFTRLFHVSIISFEFIYLNFSHIFLDEAGQASESDIWIPLGGLANEHTSVIFCGDPKQLGPVNTLDLPRWVLDQFDSPLVRYMKIENYTSDP
jgi:superfamily I DNA and/or RNA helicase